MQKQAVLVCAICALAVLLTIGITYTLLKRGKPEKTPVVQPSSSEPVSSSSDVEDISDHYQISQTSSALLPQTADAGTSYQEQTLFLGDSNTVRLYANGLISLQQFCAKEGIGVSTALTETFVTFKRDDNRYTIAQAVAKMKPRRVVLTFGTNDTDQEVEDFIRNYKALVAEIQTAYPYTEIIVNTVPPVPADHGNYPNIQQTKIDDFNMALLSMCEELEIRFLNSAEALKDEDGYGRAEYYQSGDIHLKSAGLKAMLNYLRTHADPAEDRRPDTTNIPIRAEYTNDPSSAVQAPSSSASASSSKVLYEVSYRVDKNGGGTLSSETESGKALLNYDIKDPAKAITVTAVPDNGYIFIKWSDGVTDATRIDADFEEDMDLAAVFEAASIKISTSGKAVVGSTYTFKATLSNSKLKTSDIRWYSDGVEQKDAAGKKTVKVPLSEEMADVTFRIYATVTYNGTTLTSNQLDVTVGGVTSVSSSSSSSEESADSSSAAASSSSSSAASSSTAASSGSASSSASSGTTSSSSSSAASSSKSESTSGAGSTASSKTDASSETGSASSGKSESTSGSTASSSGAASSSKPDSSTDTGSSSSTAGSSSASRKEEDAVSSGTSGNSASSVKTESGSSSSASSKPAASSSTAASSSEASASREATGSAS